MNQTQGMSVRSVLIAGVSAAMVTAAAVAPVSAPALAPAQISAALDLTSITTPLEVAIKNTYNAVEPWAAYGAEWGQYVLGLIPGLWWVAPGVPLAYNTIEPLVQAGVYTLADVVGLNFGQIGPDVANGINTSINNGINYGLAWLNSLVPFPPLPPLQPLPGASVPAGAVSLTAPPAASADLLATPRASSVTTPIEVAIKNTYSAVEPWVAYGAEWAQYILGFIPGLWWVAPGVPFAYNTIEPLVQAGVYTLADVIGLNFAQIGPDVINGINTSINNAINYGLAWLGSLVPLPPLPPLPPFPGAAVAAPTASLRAAAAVTPAQNAAPEKSVTEAATATPGTAVKTESTGPAAEISAPAAPQVETPATADTPAETPAAVEAPAAIEAPVATDTAAAAEAPSPARPLHRGAATQQAAPQASQVAADRTDSGAGTSHKAERQSRASHDAG